MNRNMTLMVIISLCLFAGSAFCADWKYYGGFSTTPDMKEVLFYDSTSIVNTNNSIKLWVKIISYSDIEKSIESKSVMEKAAQKIATGYKPPITRIYPNVTNAVHLEEAANESNIKLKARILYQIACDENKFRTISGTTFNKDGALERRLGITKWEHIEPESNAENLAKILCLSK